MLKCWYRVYLFYYLIALILPLSEGREDMRHDDTLTAKVFVVCLMVILGFAIWSIVDNFFKDPEVDFDSEGISETVSINGLALVPGDEREYSFQLKCRDSGEYQVGLQMVEKIDGGLKEFINVTVELDGTVVLRGKLSDIMGTSSVVLENHKFGRDSVELVITYEMPIDVGNEAMGAYADFDMTFLLSEKGEPLNV